MHSSANRVSPTLSEALTTFALEFPGQDIPDDVLVKSRAHFLDALGIALASSTFDFAEAALQAAHELGTGAEAHAIGKNVLLPAPSAALVNGILVHGLDYDDTHIGAIYHASAPAVAAALAAGEVTSASGREVLNAYIIALEIGCRLAGAVPGAFHARGLHPTSLCGVFAATAAAARLHSASQEALVWAMGLAGSQAGGILEIGDSWLKRLHPGWAAHSGLVADALGRAGFRGPSTVFEGQHGFYLSHVAEKLKGEQLPTHKLGAVWHLMDIALKPYPCCHFIHSFVDSVFALRDQISVNSIVRIDCALSPALHHLVAEPREQKIRPTTIYQALFSVPYTVALAFVKGRIDLSTYYDEPLDDPHVLELAERTHCINDPQSDFPKQFPGEIRVLLDDGRIFTRRETASLGTSQRPLSRRSIENKFLANASRALGADGAQRVLKAVWEIDEMENICELLAMCARPNKEKSI